MSRTAKGFALESATELSGHEGVLDDGAAGLVAVKSHGDATLVVVADDPWLLAPPRREVGA